MLGGGIFTEIAQAIKPSYTTPAPNTPLLLYKGPITLIHDQHFLKGSGVVTMQWIPSPHPRFEVVTRTHIVPETTIPIELLYKDWSISLDDLGVSPMGRILTVQTGQDERGPIAKLQGVVVRPIMHGDDSPLTSLQFHVTNFVPFVGNAISHGSPPGASEPSLGRISFECKGWRITVDSVEGLSELLSALPLAQGHAITHVGIIERADASPFKATTARAVLDDLQLLLGFAAGRSVACVLLEGRSRDGQVAWHDWTALPFNGWKHTSTWFDLRNPGVLGALLPSLQNKLADEKWRDAINGAIYWYIQGTEIMRNSDRAVISLQVALEILASMYLRDDQDRLSRAGFEKLEFHDKLRLLLQLLHIPTRLPFDLRARYGEATPADAGDGPSFFTQIRNGIVHAKKRPVPRAIWADYLVFAQDLGNWYVELIILRLLDCPDFDAIAVRRLALGEKIQIVRGG